MPSSALLRRHTTRFTSFGHLQIASKSETKEICASVDRLKSLLPADIDPKEHETLLYVVGNLMVGGTVNRNDDAMSIEDTLRVYPRFEGQFIDIEHNRGTVVAYIVKAGLSELGTDRIITAEEARAANKPFNLAIVIAIWRVVDRDLCNYIVRSAQPGSPDRDKLSFSFEVGFDDYDVILLPKGASNLSQVTKVISPDMNEFERFDKMLRCNGGKGVYGDKNERVARVLVGNILPLGGGIVANPAAAVKGLAPVLTSPHVDPSKGADAGMYTHSSTQVTLHSTDAARYLDYASTIPDDHLYNGEGEEKDKYGREDSPHVTALYGLTSADAEPIRALLASFGPITMTMGKVSAFQRDEKPYDVIKADIDSPDLHRLNDLLRSSFDHESSFPEYHPHCTLAYTRKGVASQYIGDTRFEGHSMTFNSISFRPHTGDPVDISLTPSVPQITAEQVYSDEDDIMAATPSRFIKLSAGWQDSLANMRLPVTGGDPLVNGVNVTLSDGRVLKNVKIFDGKTLELDKELSMDGAIVTSMTPGMPPQNDDGKPIHPHAGDSYPVVTPESQQKQDVQTAYKDQAIMGPYTDASAKDDGEKDKSYGDVEYADPGYQEDKKKRYPVDTEEHIRAAWSYINQEKNASQYSAEQVKHIKSKIIAAWKKKIDPAGPESAKASADEIVAAIVKLLSEQTDFTNTCIAGVSSANPPSISMNLDEIKQAIASVTSVEELNTAVANSQFFTDVIAKASEKMAQERDAAKTAATQTEASLKDIQKELSALHKSHDEAVAAQIAAAAETAFNDRMTAVEEVFAFDDDTRAELVTEIKACADDESFSKWMTKAKKLYKGWAKAENVVERKDGKDKKDAKPDDAEPDEDDAACASAAKTALASAQSNPVDTPIANDLGDLNKNGKTIADQMREVLGSSVSVGGKTVNELTEAADKTVRRTR